MKWWIRIKHYDERSEIIIFGREYRFWLRGWYWRSLSPSKLTGLKVERKQDKII